jgi:ankyrin repeat protein
MAIMGDYSAYRVNKVGPMVDFLLERGVSVNSPPSEEHTSALHAAISGLNTQFVDRLLEAGADVNAHDPRFGTALTAAAFRGGVDTMKKLLERGADLALAGEKYGLVTDTPPSRFFTSH